jgi:hypothetical protein
MAHYGATARLAPVAVRRDLTRVGLLIVIGTCVAALALVQLQVTVVYSLIICSIFPGSSASAVVLF